MTFIKTTQTLAADETKKVIPGPVFHQFLTPVSGPKKAQNPTGVDSGTPEPWPPLI